MRYLDQSKNFKQDLKRIGRGIYRSVVHVELKEIVNALRNDEPLAPKYRDHSLTGDRKGYRECHVKPDLLLMYAYIGTDWLRLERLGSHAELFGM